MTTDYRERIEQLQQQAEFSELGPVKVALLEEAVRLADLLQDTALGFELREELTTAATFSGAPDKMLVAFSWRLAQCDREPERFNEKDLLWHYKWIAGALNNFPQISRQQVSDTLADMEQRYRRAGLSLRPVWKECTRVAMGFGDREAARKTYARWRKTQAGRGNDCVACDLHFQVQYLLFAGRIKQALAQAAPLLAGSRRCMTVPHNTYGNVLRPLVHLGRLEEAAAYHRKGYPMVAGNRNFLEVVADHLEYLVLTDNRTAAVRMLEKHLIWALESPELDHCLDFHLAARFLMERLRECGTDSLKLRLPQAFPGFRQDGRYESATLADWFDRASRELAARFDARSGNDYYQRQTDLGPLKKLVKPYPLSK